MKKSCKKILCTVSALSSACLLSGCFMVGADYVEPELNDLAQNTAWQNESNSGVHVTADEKATENLARWWTHFNDPFLSSLIERGTQGNLDVKEAFARVRAARAALGIKQAALFPTLDASGALTSSKRSENIGAASGNGDEEHMHSAAFDAGWEIDIFGGRRRATEAAYANLEASEAGLRDVYVSLLAEIAQNYINVRTYQQRLLIAEANLREQAEAYELVASRYESGLSNALAKQQAQYSLETTRAEVPALQAQLDANVNSLALLLGLAPRSLHAEFAELKDIPLPPLDVAIGVPANALRNRPDIRLAERQLAAKTSEVGVAKADLYPRFFLSGSIGVEASYQSNLFETGSQVYSYGPSISWPIFRAGAIWNNINVASAVQEQYAFAYERAVLLALNEAQRAITDYAKEQQRRDALAIATKSARHALTLTTDQYSNGLIDFDRVLDERRTLLSLEQQLAMSRGQVSTNLVRIYKAMGGGWQSLAETGGEVVE